jgi:hypothetical protein
MRVTHNFALYVNYEGQLRFLVCTAINSAAVKDVECEMCASCLKSFKLSSGNPHCIKVTNNKRIYYRIETTLGSLVVSRSFVKLDYF